MEIIEVCNLFYKYPTSRNNIINGISLKIKKGELCAIIGSNGSGKTTLCNAIRGFVPHFYKGDMQGDIWIDGKNVREYSLGELALKIGYVFQNPFTQISGIKDTVFEEIAYGLENIGVAINEIKSRVQSILDFLAIDSLKDRNPFELSGGQRQKIALASIIVMEPDILVIDEPTSQLDPQATEEIFKIIELMKEKGKTIILIEHKIELIAEYADHVVLINDGRVVMDGSTEEILTNRTALDFGVALPQYALLGLEMRNRNLKLDAIPITEAQAEVELLKYMRSRRPEAK